MESSHQDFPLGPQTRCVEDSVGRSQGICKLNMHTAYNMHTPAVNTQQFYI